MEPGMKVGILNNDIIYTSKLTIELEVTIQLVCNIINDITIFN